MASSSALSFPPLHPFLSSTTLPLTSSPTPSLTVHCLLSIAFPSRHCLPARVPLSVACSASSGAREAHLEEERKREVLQSYGLDPSDFEPKPSPRQRRSRREEEMGKKGRRRTPLPPPPPEEPKPPRTTHKLLHVLAGKARRKKLLSPKGMDVRPMMELVRGAAFDIIQVAGGCPASLRPGRWLDLYSGTGSVGIEAISRGCLEAHFVEMDPWVVSEVLKPNLEWTGFLDVSVIHMTRVENFLDHAALSFGSDGSFDYISVTPPYTQVDYNTLMGQLENSPLVGKDTFILVEYPLRTSMPEACGYLIKIADRRFGRTHLAIYGPTWAQKKKKYEASLLALGSKKSANVHTPI